MYEYAPAFLPHLRWCVKAKQVTRLYLYLMIVLLSNLVYIMHSADCMEHTQKLPDSFEQSPVWPEKRRGATTSRVGSCLPTFQMNVGFTVMHMYSTPLAVVPLS